MNFLNFLPDFGYSKVCVDVLLWTHLFDFVIVLEVESTQRQLKSKSSQLLVMMGSFN
jgi:hypothetical protein